MKAILKSTVVLLLLSMSVTAMAYAPDMSLTLGAEGKSLVFRMDAKDTEARIKLVNEDAVAIYSERVSNADYAKTFNLEGLSMGTYYFSVKNRKATMVFTFTINEDGIELAERKKENTRAIFRKRGKKVSVNLLNSDLGRVEIIIIDAQNNMVFKEISKNKLHVGKVLSFQSAARGAYTVMVNNGEDAYYQHVYVD
ncbi:hypothetical protein [Maribacter sp. 2307ULW6-5]|uniref:hypothetical protein n=1 Tax=Maribacter sp. 2307ULW6-5 TaxID=3386275 RepID=UPI0039BD7791